MDFPLTPDGYRVLHKHLFQDLYEWAGQDRTVNIGKQGSLFAHAPYIANGLNAMFKELGEKNNFRGLKRSEEHTSELQSLMRISYAVFCLKKKKPYNHINK